MNEIVMNILLGIVSGCISGMLVFLLTKKREDAYQTYYYLYDYLFRTMDNLQIELPSELLRYSSKVGGRESDWGVAFYNVIDLTRKYELSDREFDEKEEELANNLLVALNELNNWALKKHLIKSHKNKKSSEEE